MRRMICVKDNYMYYIPFYYNPWSSSKVAKLSLKVKNTPYIIELSVKSPYLHTIFGPAFTPYHQNPGNLYL